MGKDINVAVYIATSMSGRDKAELVKRAARVCEIFREYGIRPISPVIEEKVKDEPVKLINSNKEQLKKFWSRDKEILIKEAHVLFWDKAEQKSFGVEREYGLMRFALWKPVVSYIAVGTPMSVASLEDDAIFSSVHQAAEYIVAKWGTARKRRLWRIKMLIRTLPLWVYRQYLAWR